MRRLVWLGFWLLVGVCTLLLVSSEARMRLVHLLSPRWESSHVFWRGADRMEAPVGERIRVAIAAMISPARTFLYYKALFDLVGKQVGSPVELLQRKTYKEVNELFANGQVDMAWICTGSWPELSHQGTAKLLVAPQINGRTTYRSYLVVRASAPYHSLLSLRGARIAFSDPLSLTGFRLPLLMVRNLGFRPEEFFGSHFYTFSHDNSISAVNSGLADVAGVDSLIFDFLKTVAPDEVKGLRILAASPEVANPPVVISASLDPRREKALKLAFLHLHEYQEGSEIIRSLQIERFVEISPRSYANIP